VAGGSGSGRQDGQRRAAAGPDLARYAAVQPSCASAVGCPPGRLSGLSFP
jgi:hypothetical protein